MVNHTEQSAPKQLELFPILPFKQATSAAWVDERPAPIQTAHKFNFPLQHYAPITEGQEYQYSILDWIRGLTGDTQREASKSWDRMKNELSISTGQLDYIAADGKTYQAAFTNAKGLYLISQSLRVTKARPQLKEVREFLATSAAWVELIGRDKKAAKVGRKQIAQHHGLREESIAQRKDFTATVARKSLNPKPQYGLLSNAIYSRLFRIGTEYTAKREIVAILGLSSAQAKHMRDNINSLALSAVKMAEEAAMVKIDNSPDKLSDEEMLGIVKHCARIVASSAHDLANYAGVDLLTGQAILPSGKGR